MDTNKIATSAETHKDAKTTEKCPLGNENNQEQRNLTQNRFIKVVSIDSKKIKELGIESNILSAMTKFSAKRNSNAQPLASQKSQTSKSATLASILPSKLEFKSSAASSSTNPSSMNLQPQIASSATRSVDSNKKVHVLSQVTILPGTKTLNLETISSISNKLSDIFNKDRNIETHDKIPTNCDSSQSIKPTTAGTKPNQIVDVNPSVSVATCSTLPRKKVSSPKKSQTEPSSLVEPIEKSKFNKLRMAFKNYSSEDEDDFYGFSLDLSSIVHEQISALEKFFKNQQSLCSKQGNVTTIPAKSTSTSALVANNKICPTATLIINESVETEIAPDLTASSQSESEEETVENLVRQAGQILKEEFGVDVDSQHLQSPKSPNKSDSSIEKDALIDDFLDATKSRFQVELENSSSDSSHSELNTDLVPDTKVGDNGKRKILAVETPKEAIASSSPKKSKEIDLSSIFLPNVSAEPPPKRHIPNISQLKPIMAASKSPRKSAQINSKQKKLTEFFQKSPTAASTPVADNSNDLKLDLTNSFKRRRSVLNYNDLLNSSKIGKNRAETLSKISEYVSDNIVKIDDISESIKETDTLDTSTPIVKRGRGRRKNASISEGQPKTETVISDEQGDVLTVDNLPKLSLNESVVETTPNNELVESKKAGRRGRKPKVQTDSKIEDFNVEEVKKEPNLEESYDTEPTLRITYDKTIGRSGRRRIFPTTETNAEDHSNVITTESSDSVTKSASKRGRKRKVQIENEDIDFQEASAPVEAQPEIRRGRKSRHEIKEEISLEETPTKTSRKTTRKPKSNITEPELSSQHIAVDLSDSTNILAFRKGRPTKEYLIQRKQLEDKIKKSVPEFTCGKCKAVIPAKSWQSHGKVHYGMYWRDGIDAPLDLDDTKNLIVAINKYLKLNKNANLVCIKCKTAKKSALGYLSHIEFCGLNAEEIDNVKVKCEFCEGLYKKSSIQSHIQGFCPVKRAIEAEKLYNDRPVDLEPTPTEQQEDAQPVFSESGRVKRKAAQTKTNYKDVADAVYDHNDSDDSYKCDESSSSGDDSLDEGDDVDESAMNSDFSGDESFDIELYLNEKRNRKDKKRREKEANKTHDNVQKPDATMIWSHYTSVKSYRQHFYTPAHKWTREFRIKNYFNNVPFLETIGIPPEAIDLVDLNTVCPLSESPHFCHSVPTMYYKIGTMPDTDYKWMRLKCGQYTSQDDSHTLFCGGQIEAMAWATLPQKHSCDEVLAVCIKGDAEQIIMVSGPTEPLRSLIQLWAIPSNNPTRELKLVYAIECNDGPIVAIQFCPSGGYIANQRLGLLAVGTFDGNVDILALPSIDNLVKDEEHSNATRLLKKTPVISLRCTLGGERQSSVCKLAWSQTKGHSVIAAGFTNGLVAIWNLDNMKFAHLIHNSGSCIVLLPIQILCPSFTLITQLDFHHDSTKNARWLLVGSLDRRVKIFDMENATPIEITTFLYRSRIRSGHWPVHWNVYFSLIDDSLAYKTGGLTAKQPLNICQGRLPTIFTDGDTSTLAFSDWLNTCIFGNSHGDIFVNYFTQLLRQATCSQHDGKGVIGFTEIVPINSMDGTPTSSSKSNEHGLIFCDFSSPILAKRARKRRVYPFTKNTIMRIDHVAINPNENSCRTYAIAYQNGLVRIKIINLIKKNKINDPEP